MAAKLRSKKRAKCVNSKVEINCKCIKKYMQWTLDKLSEHRPPLSRV